MKQVFLILLVVSLVGGCSRGDDYGDIEFSSINNSYAVYMIKQPGSEPQVLAPKVYINPVGLGGVVSVPKCYRWGVLLFTPLELEKFVEDAKVAKLPELTIVDNGYFDESQLKLLKKITSLRRIDVRTCRNVNDAVLAGYASMPNIEEIWLSESGRFTESGIKSLEKQYPKLKILHGKTKYRGLANSDSIMGFIQDGRNPVGDSTR